MPIRWKVVKVDRCSIYAQGNYKLYYHKGSTVKAVQKSVGILVFERKKQALAFLFHTGVNGKVLKTEGIGRGKRPKALSKRQAFDSIDRFYERLFRFYEKINVLFTKERYQLLKLSTLEPPEGTIAYQKVKVLE